MNQNGALERIVQVYMAAGVVWSGKHWTTINELTDQIPAMRPTTLLAAQDLLTMLGHCFGTKILGEEDKGAMLASAYANFHNIPLAMARKYSYDIPDRFGSIPVHVSMEYDDHQARINGIDPGDVVTLIDDTLATGGTAVSLIKACESRGAQVLQMFVVAEKLGMGGRARVYEEFGIEVQACLGIFVSGAGVVVRTAFGKPLEQRLLGG